ncbi:nucleotide sugar dehydrogenase [Cryobacterium levicorallinum]|uniref:Nucleotide sugar dehydrogenase n=2 Tax=Cryobacterium levicorallinum TaxID=995038 RepID=A0A1I3EMM4_9MICO|nr:nucleotide sugar dehydrogenase [Cryobacterium levicorallinum]SFI00209.1 UDP-N-acetyl-D-glucosamine dehydrogenase [Cryobacterium levicorallinum]
MRAVEVGFKVVGIDLDISRIDRLKAGESYVEDIPESVLRSALDSGMYLPTASYDDVTNFDIAIITVPTPLRDSLPDLTFIESSGVSLASHLKVGATVVLESTTYPGTTQELLVPILEEGSGLAAGRDFFVGYSPERIDPGNKTWGFVETPKVVSGINMESLAKVKGFYDALVETTVPVSSPKEAELTKLLENTFRHVNIALVNELAIFANQLGVNVWESIEAASTKPFGFMKFTPGPGVGGHCLPVDPSYLSWQVRRQLGQNFRFVELANDINDHMPDYVIQRLIAILNRDSKALRGSRVLLVGLAYKKNTGDFREAPSRKIIDLLVGLGAEVSAIDSHIEPQMWPQNVISVGSDLVAVSGFDAIVLLTDHDDLDVGVFGGITTPILDTQCVMSGPNVEVL